MDAALLITALHAGATIVGTEVVKEVTKDAYKALKGAVVDLFGRRATTAIERLENTPADETSVGNLQAVVGTASPDDMRELASKIQALLTALQSDDEARKMAASVAKIKLDVDAGGNVILDTIHGAWELDVKAKAGDDFVMKNVAMDSRTTRGN